ncbi:hypothetical protein JRQ81_014578, partial [Phrynocephalus forsythii]
QAITGPPPSDSPKDDLNNSSMHASTSAPTDIPAKSSQAPPDTTLSQIAPTTSRDCSLIHFSVDHFKYASGRVSAKLNVAGASDLEYVECKPPRLLTSVAGKMAQAVSLIFKNVEPMK